MLRKIVALPYVFLWLAIVVFILANIYDNVAGKAYDLNRFADKIETKLHQLEQEVNSFLGDGKLIEAAADGKLQNEYLTELNKKLYTICIYENDSLRFWSNNKVLPYLTDIKPIDGRVNKTVGQKNGEYELIKETYFNNRTKRSLTILGLIPIYYKFPVNNDYLKDRIVLDSSIPDFIVLSDSEGVTVRNLEDKPLFKIQSKRQLTKKNRGKSFLFYLLGFVLLGLFINELALRVVKTRGFLPGFSILLGSVLLVRLMSYYFTWLGEFRDIEIFHPRHFASNIFPSIGDLLIDILLVLWIIAFFNFLFRPKRISKLSKGVQYLIGVSIYFAITSAVFAISRIFISLARNSEITLEFNNIFSLNLYSFCGLFSLTLLTGSLFIFSQKLMVILSKTKINSIEKVFFIVVMLALTTVINYLNLLSTSSLILIIFSMGFIVLFELFIRAKSITYFWLLTWLIIFSIFSTVLLYNYNYEKEFNTRRLYALKLAEENDRYTVFKFQQIYENLVADKFVQNFFVSPWIPKSAVVDRIQKKYIRTYLFNKYNSNVHVYNANGGKIKGEMIEYASFQKLISTGNPTGLDYLHYWLDNTGKLNYIADIPIVRNNAAHGRIIITLLAKEVKGSRLYPALLLDKQMKSSQKMERYNYAIYENGQRYKSNGNFYPYLNPFQVKKGFQTVTDDSYVHLVYVANKNKTIVVTKENEEFIRPVSLFSYMFCLQLLVMILILLFDYVIKNISSGKIRSILRLRPTLRNRINLSVISMIILSFLIIGIVTVIYFRGEFTKYHDQRLGRKVRGVLASIKVEMEKNEDNPYYIPDISDLSEIHRMDINLYDLQGDLEASSQLAIVDIGLISDKIDPVAFYNLDRVRVDQHNQEEAIGQLMFKTAYVPLKTAKGEIVGYIGLPYYSQLENLREDVSEFMGTLLNVYVLLLIFSGLVAILIGNSVTSPIVTIGEKLKQVKLGRKNTQLEWDNDDEIGALVIEYNKMINELEESANLLAQSNRETAWREMAKQVAHEIKNPLTPMKLSIQHLQRASKESDLDDIQGMVNRVSKTLVEQIDSLSNIASSFSNFAKMPKATNEKFVINSTISSVFNLFSERDNMNISLELPMSEFIVFADRNQMVRALNNLIKNAIQAIPETREGNILISLSKKETMAVIEVRDNGIGIPEDKQINVFVPNFTTKSSGTGLGLAITRNIVESAAGKIYFETEVDKGTSFFIELPIVNRS